MITLRNLIDQAQALANRAPHLLDKTLKARCEQAYSVEGICTGEDGACIELRSTKADNAIFEQDSEEVHEADADLLAEDE